MEAEATTPRGPALATSTDLGEAEVPLDEFEVLDGDAGRSLGKGSFGVVRRIRRKGSGEVYALKTMQKIEVIEGDLIEQVEREIQVQRTLKHENVLRLYKHFEDAETVYLLLEYCAKGELYQLLRTRRGRRFPEPVARHYFHQVTKGLRFLHSQCIVHRDLKPENLLVNQDDVLKIADFGWCAVSTVTRMTFCGTLDYLAPEMVQGKGHNHTLDIWSLGVLLYEMVVGRPPFQSTNHVTLIAKILATELKFPAFVPPPVVNLVLRLLQREPTERMPLDQVLRSAWVLKLYDGATHHGAAGLSALSECPGAVFEGTAPSTSMPLLEATFVVNGEEQLGSATSIGREPLVPRQPSRSQPGVAGLAATQDEANVVRRLGMQVSPRTQPDSTGCAAASPMGAVTHRAPAGNSSAAVAPSTGQAAMPAQAGSCAGGPGTNTQRLSTVSCAPTPPVWGTAATGFSAVGQRVASGLPRGQNPHPSPPQVFRSPPQTPIQQAQFRNIAGAAQPVPLSTGQGRGALASNSSARNGSKDGGLTASGASAAIGLGATRAPQSRTRRDSSQHSVERSSARRPRSSGPGEKTGAPTTAGGAWGPAGSPAPGAPTQQAAQVQLSQTLQAQQPQQAPQAPQAGTFPPASPAVQQRLAAPPQQAQWGGPRGFGGYPAAVAPSPCAVGRSLSPAGGLATAATVAAAVGAGAPAAAASYGPRPTAMGGAVAPQGRVMPAVAVTRRQA